MFKKVAAVLPEGKYSDRIFSETITPACAEADVVLARVATEFSTEPKRVAINESIAAADLVVADLSGKNPNVMYLVGLAHSLGRKVLLIGQFLEDFPFDRAAHPVIGYGTDRELLKRELASYLKSGQRPSDKTADSLNAPYEKFVSLFGDILKAHQYEHRGQIELENPTTFVLLDQDMDLALVQALARRSRELGLRLKLM